LQPSTLGRRVAAIRYAHKLAHLDTPTDSEAVKATLRGIRRTVGAAKGRKAPAVAATMRAMVALAPPGLKGLRDRALLLLGFAGAFRRSELVALDVAYIAETQTGLLVTIRRSKTDQDGEGVTIAITQGDAACPARALREWLDAAGIEAGPILRPINKAGTVSGERLTDRSVAVVVGPRGRTLDQFLASGSSHPANASARFDLGDSCHQPGLFRGFPDGGALTAAALHGTSDEECRLNRSTQHRR
jgi:hypothetical protein